MEIEAPISERQTLQELSLIKLIHPQAQATPVSILPAMQKEIYLFWKLKSLDLQGPRIRRSKFTYGSEILPLMLKYIYSEKATKYCEISTVDLTGTTQDKSTVEISEYFVAVSEYMNFKRVTNLSTDKYLIKIHLCLLHCKNSSSFH